ncbi:daptide-type RiPP biosynthesis methyltransferase [Motilibacter deserti]|uniref:Class I SAM-dependent methyltransferase n=1 Tax=Motilibacter deserti TaxID=2714956 RepID=A0ABX0GXP0_9ACTN|nr:daptide-type RiPP biosynthesis methyltransferase [Motilibacter deserti]NHC15592.1 class I SAM-dependent methyltransferase [Motilibacter deserti]
MAATLTAPALGGTARRLAEALGDTLRVSDLYDGGAWVYDRMVENDTAEVPELLAAARGLRGDVLDLGAGSGRLTMPFLARGHRVVALDNAAAMLAELAQRAARLPGRLHDRLEPALGDMAALDFGERRFDIVLLGTTTVSLLDDEARRATFRGVRAHLAPGGRFLVSSLCFPAGRRAETVDVVALASPSGGTALATLIEELRPDEGARSVSVLVQHLEPPAPPELFLSAPRMVDEASVTADLAAAGLAVTARQSIHTAPDGRETVLFTCHRDDEGETK